MNERSKYYPLYQFLRQSGQDIVILTVADIKNVLGTNLPVSAWNNRGWWSNRRVGAVQALAWLDAGYKVDGFEDPTPQSTTSMRITFRRIGVVPDHIVRRQGNIVQWDSAMIKALREHMGLTQSEFAQELGVRQPTVSEWETSSYEPKRSSSKLLSMIAERAGFTYE